MVKHSNRLSINNKKKPSLTPQTIEHKMHWKSGYTNFAYIDCQDSFKNIFVGSHFKQDLALVYI